MEKNAVAIQSNNATEIHSLRREKFTQKQNNGAWEGGGGGARRISNLRQCAHIGIRMQIHCVLSARDKTTVCTRLFIRVCESIIE